MVAAAEGLQGQCIGIGCISMPSWELFKAFALAPRRYSRNEQHDTCGS
jgi:hypothetical protein